ncbi:MAG: polysaccharide biosynthesis C-terminal domain-containing protein [Myxococcales bacterium]|nr:polysaccharide biosynthesis C-terminal domain-containing protein [Myxococcales bacterium]
MSAPTQRLVRNTGWGLLGVGLSAPLALAIQVLLARWLPPAENGQVQAALSLLAVLAFAAQPGAVAASIHRVRAAGTAPPEALTVALSTVTVTGAAVAAVLWLGRDALAAGPLVGLPEWALGWMLLAVVPQLWLLVLGGVARATDRFSLWTQAELGSRLAILAALAVGVAATEPSPAVALAAVCAGVVVATGMVAARLAGDLPGRARLRWGEVAASLRFGTRTYLHTLTGQLHERVDLFLLAVLDGDPVVVATYAVAVGVASRLRVLPLALSAALFPQLAGMRGEQGAQLLARATRIAVAVLVVGGLAVVAVAPWAMPWVFGVPYAASVPLLWVLLPATATMSVSLLVGRFFQAVDRQGVLVVAQGVGVACNLVLNLWWIPAFGAAGAAWASLVSYGVQAAWCVVALMRSHDLSPWSLLVIRPGDLRGLWPSGPT